ncbi:MAG: protein kinase [Polyangiaceae bacterium]|nr:protein kinase [Polyangiaceae bacterium]
MLRFWQRRKEDDRTSSSPEASGSEPKRAAGQTPFQPGMQIAGKFTLQRLIGSGSMGSVFEAWDMFVERRVAIKLMHPGYDRDPAMIARFRREAQTTAAIRHPNVVTIHEVGQRRDGTFYMVQELLAGETLRDYLAARGRLSEHEAMTIMVPIMGALVTAHKRGIVHRDIKPENIILTSTSSEIVPKLVDFGLARVHTPEPGRNKLTLHGAVMGTPEYMSPEQAEGLSSVDARADVWSVGAVFFELLSGKRPYDGQTQQAVLVKIITQPPPILSMLVDDIPASFLEVIQQALVPDKEKRLQSMQIFRDKLVLAFERMSQHAVFAQPLSVDDDIEEVPDDLPIHQPSDASGSDVLELDPADLVLDEDTHIDGTDVISVGSGLSPVPRAEHEWREAVDASRETPLSRDEAKAIDALSLNALRDAVKYADKVLAAFGDEPGVRARMRLVHAVAYRWIGKLPETKQAAEDAMALFPRGSTAFHAALGHLIIACGNLGDADRIREIANEHANLEAEGVTSEGHIISASRLAVALVRVGEPERAHEVLAAAQKLAFRHSVTSPFVLAWLDVARSEAALHEADLTSYVRRIERAVENFTSAGDMRNTCLQRVNIGNAYVHLGAYALAENAFRQALAMAEPMQLDFVSSILANLGHALAHLGNLDEARKVEFAALERVIKQGNRRGQGFISIYMSVIMRLAGDKDGALAMAKRALEVSEGAPAIRAYALALMAGIAIAKNKEFDALVYSREATDILNRLEGIEEGESLIRWTHALALRAAGHDQEAEKHIADARERLLKKAERITDPKWRQSFLEQVPDNARVMEFASSWLGDVRDSAGDQK